MFVSLTPLFGHYIDFEYVVEFEAHFTPLKTSRCDGHLQSSSSIQVPPCTA